MKNFLIHTCWVLAGVVITVAFINIFTASEEEQVAKIKAYTHRQMEYAYFEGQRDAITGDVRIISLADGRYKWVKSPWDQGDKQPEFDPLVDTTRYMGK